MRFPSITELTKNRSLIGQVLSQLPATILNEAEKQSDPWTWLAAWVKSHPIEHWRTGTLQMRDAECAALEQEGFKRTAIGVYSADAKTRHKTKIYKGIREVRFNFHKHDPSKVIMRLIMEARWPNSFRKTFEAAASQRSSLLRLVEVGRDGGSISKSWRSEIQAALKRGDQKGADHWANKQTASILQTERGRQWLLEGKVKTLTAPPKIRMEARRRYEAFYAADVRRLGKKKADQKWKGSPSTDSRRGSPFKLKSNGDKIALAMTMGWLMVGRNGFPGFCFMSDEILAQFLGRTLPLPSLLSDGGWKFVRTIRERIGLKKGEVLVNGIKHLGGIKWAVLNHRGEEAGRFEEVSKSVPPKL